MASGKNIYSEKKRLPWIVRFLRNILIIVVILIGGIFAAFFVNDKTEVSTNDQTNVQTVYYSALSKSVDDIEETKKMRFSLEQIFVNSVIKKGLESAGEKVQKYVTGAYFVINDSSTITIGIKLKLAFFLSRVQIICNFERFFGPGEENSGVKFSISEVKIGRVPGFANVLSVLSKAFKVDSLLTGMVSAMGLSAELKIENREIVYSYANLTKDLKKIIQNTRSGEGSTKLEIFEDFLGRYIRQEFVDIGMDSDKIEVRIDCNSLTAGDIPEKRIQYDYEKLREMINILLPKNPSLKQKDVLQYLTYYYVHGYSNSSLSTRQMMDQIDFSDYTEITDYKTHKGAIPLTQNYNLQEEIQDQLLTDSITTIQKINNGQPILDLTDINFATTIRENRTILGYASVLERIEDEKIIFNFMSIKDFYCEINQREVDFHIIVSLNGLDMNFVLKTKAEAVQGGRFLISFVVEKVLLGENEVDFDTMKEILNVLVQSTENNILTVYTEEGAARINFDLSHVIRDYPQILNAIISNNKKVTIEDGSPKDHLILSFK